MRRKLKIVIFRKLTMFGPRWFFTIRAANGEKIAQSEGYANRADCASTASLFIDRDFEVVEAAR